MNQVSSSGHVQTAPCLIEFEHATIPREWRDQHTSSKHCHSSAINTTITKQRHDIALLLSHDHCLFRALLNWLKCANKTPAQPIPSFTVITRDKSVNWESSFVKVNMFNQVCQAWGKYPLLWLCFYCLPLFLLSLPPNPATFTANVCLEQREKQVRIWLLFVSNRRGKLNCNHTPPHLWHTPDTR